MHTNKLDNFFDRLKSIGFLERLFSWRKIKDISFDAFRQYIELIQSHETLMSENESLKDKLSFSENELEKVNYFFEEKEKSRRENYQKNVSELNALRLSLEMQIKDLHEKELNNQQQKLDKLKETWKDHENNVNHIIKNLCKSHLIEFIDKVPFKGSPDNTIFISGEYIIFDAKSPANNNLENFPAYIKSQVEALKKYAKQENVKRDIFLIVPSNTLDILSKFNYVLSDYTVYIISPDAIEPIILMLKKVEEYEFAEQLSPEDRDNISRIIGKFIHTSKRRIEIDLYFAHHVYEILSKVEYELPEELSKLIKQFERVEKINPPRDDRSKEINLNQILKNDLLNQ